MKGTTTKTPDNVVRFVENWNNKLQNYSFTTVRPVNHRKYIKGKSYWIELFDVKKGKYVKLGNARLVASSSFYLNNISDTMSFIDANMRAEDFKKLITRLYSKSSIDVQLIRFNMLVFQFEKRVYNM